MKVVAASIESQEGLVLISKRPAHTYGGGLWELPGGKLEAGETPEQALSRELKEELGIQISNATPLINIDHQYPDRKVHLMVYQVNDFEGVPDGLEGQEIRWVTKEALPNYTFPGANKPAIDAIRLPNKIAFVSAVNGDSSPCLNQIEKLFSSGVGCILIENSAGDMWAKIEQKAHDLCEKYSVMCIPDKIQTTLEQGKTHGLHLTKKAMREMKQRPLAGAFWLSAHCDSAEDLAHAEAVGVDFVLFGTLNSNGIVEPLSLTELETVAKQTKLPVYAAVEVGPEGVEKIRAKGGRGTVECLNTLIKN